MSWEELVRLRTRPRSKCLDQRHAHPRIEPVGAAERLRWSVMIPTYNGTRFLAETLASVVDQAAPNMQIEVVDDHSTLGDVEALVAEVGGGRVSYYRQPQNVGHTRNFNTCLQRARGELVHLLHDDDVVRDGFYRRYEELLDAWPAGGAVVCRHAFIDEDGIQRALGPLLRTEPGVLEDWLQTIARGQVLQPPSVVVRRSVYETVGGFNESIRRYGEDWEMYVRVASATAVIYTPEILVGYRRRRSGSLSDMTHVRRNMADMRHIVQSNEKVLRDSDVEDPRVITQRARRDLSEWLLWEAVANLRARQWSTAGAITAQAVLVRRSGRIAVRAAAIAAHVTGKEVAARSPVVLEVLGPTKERLVARRRRRRSGAAAASPTSPREVSEAVGAAPVVPLGRARHDPHHERWRVGDDQMLHAYDPPNSEVRRALSERKQLRDAGLPHGPEIVSEHCDSHVVWVLEREPAGRRLYPADFERSFDFLAAHIQAIGGPPGPALRTTDYWSCTVDAAVSLAPAHLRAQIRSAWGEMADLPARVLHGDANRANVVLGPNGPALIQWDHTWRFGPPGFDLLSFAATTPEGPETHVLEALAGGTDATGRPVLGRLGGAGVPGSTVRAVVLAALSAWALREQRRHQDALGGIGHETPYRAALEELARVLELG